MQARENYRLLNIKRLEALIEELNEEIKRIQVTREALILRKSTLRDEFEKLPSLMDLDVAIQEVRELNQRLQISKEAEEKATKEVEFSKEQLERARTLVHNITKEIPIGSNLESYENAVIQCRKYLRGINNLRNTAIK